MPKKINISDLEFQCTINGNESISITKFDLSAATPTRKPTKILFKKEIKLLPISNVELLNLRLTNTSILILKKDEELFYCTIPKELNLSKHCHLLTHKCMQCTKSSLLKCKKIEDRFFKEDNFLSADERRTEMFLSKRIEKYPFILYGIETYNTVSDSFLVLTCNN